MAQEDFVIKIADFGFAREADGMIDSYCGTPLNMAPEILEKKMYNLKADIWSLGVILFELITGKPPFKARTKSELKANIMNGEFKIPKQYEISIECLDFINKCL